MSIEDIFAGIDETEADAGSGRLPFITDGDYLLEVDKFIAKESAHPDSEGEHMVISEVTVLETTRDIQGVSLQPGARAVIIWKLERTRPGKLTTKGQRNMGRVKSFVAALLGGVDPSAVTVATCAGLAKGDGDGVKGMKVTCEAVKNSKGTFTNLEFGAA